jgi:hypothetical protein
VESPPIAFGSILRPPLAKLFERLEKPNPKKRKN